jgi:hypothetical protein
LQLLNIAGNPNLASFVKFSVVLKELATSMDLDAEKFINDEREAFRQAQIIREAGGMQPQQQPQGMSPMDMSGGGGGNIGVGGAAVPGEQGFSAAGQQPEQQQGDAQAQLASILGGLQ